MRLQERQFEEELKPTMKRFMDSPAVQHMNDDDARVVLASIAKVKNQAGSVNQPIRQTLENPNASAATVLQSIYNHSNQWVDNGVEHTIKGAKLFNALSKDESVLGKMFDEQMQHNPMHVENFKKNPQEQILDAMFRNPAAGLRLLDAVNHNKEYVINANNAISKEAFTVGVNAQGELYTRDRNNHGYTLQNGQWHENGVQQQSINPASQNQPLPFSNPDDYGSLEVPARYAALHGQVHEHISRLYTEKGIAWSNGGENTVAKCTAGCVEKNVTEAQFASVENGKINIGQKDGFVWNVATVDAVQAARTPQLESFAQLAALDLQQSLQQDNPTQTQNKTRSGPSMG